MEFWQHVYERYREASNHHNDALIARGIADNSSNSNLVRLAAAVMSELQGMWSSTINESVLDETNERRERLGGG